MDGYYEMPRPEDNLKTVWDREGSTWHESFDMWYLDGKGTGHTWTYILANHGPLTNFGPLAVGDVIDPEETDKKTLQSKIVVLTEKGYAYQLIKGDWHGPNGDVFMDLEDFTDGYVTVIHVPEMKK